MIFQVAQHSILVLITFSLLVQASRADVKLSGGWKKNGLATARFEIHGTESRNNPLRQSLASPFSGDKLFVRYRIRYDADSIDTADEDEGEFFVLWLDAAEGNDTSTHSGGVPNLGIHVHRDENHFMARYSPSNEHFGPKLEGDRDFLVVGRLWKSTPGAEQPFDQFDFWIDPKADAELAPHASATSTGAIAEVHWLGFSTGRKTEFDDRIEVWDIEVAETWRGILDLPPKTEVPTADPVPLSQRTVEFRKHVFPLLESHCFKCHQGEDASSGVRLDILDEVLNVTAPRDAGESHLFQLVSQGEMPPEEDEVLNDKQLATLQAWIDEGLDWDEQLLPTPIPQTDHWSFQPIDRPPVPSVENKTWIRTPIDAFIARTHEQLGLTPAPEATPEVLHRRMSLDVLGLPPDAQPSESSFDVDALLSDPGYGERWGRHWLDVARWAESNGHQHNRDRPHAWRYRDWVVDAFNQGKPFDAFVREQLAGDEIAPYQDENLVATGFLAAASYSGNELDKAIQRNDILVDVVNTTAKAFLGLTMECAQCHTHKFDPISIRDYYRFQAFFTAGQPGNVVLSESDEPARTLIEQRWQLFDSVHARLVAIKRRQGHPEPIYVIPKSVIRGMKPEERARFNDLEKKIAAYPQSWSFYSPVTAGRPLPVAPHDMRWPLPHQPAVLEALRTRLLIRGDVDAPGPQVQPGWPLVFGTPPAQLEKPRTALAEWMTGSGNPLTARVWVNRIWQWHFGRGLVETSSDFGTQGAEPSDPELLDFLACELIESGWSTAHIHRLILNSATYRQSSQFSAGNAAIDPDNKMLWRWTPRRLEAEAIRDSLLAVSGQLDRTVGGPSVPEDSRRRSLYLKQRRDNFPDQQLLFDSPHGNTSCSQRRVSTTALQPLWLLNSTFVQDAAQQLARRAGSVEEAIRIALAREPSREEAAHLNALAADHGLASACLAILNSSEFLYIP